LYNLIAKSEDWLIGRILSYAQEYSFTKYTSTLEEAWKMSIIVCSGKNEHMAEENLKEAGITEWARKPLNKKEFSEIVRKVLDRRGD
jgi:DNA-binding response OmpR family regulator